ncbi:MAG: DUF4876 domain-containing protein [Candidatus Marinimicrobia bacterium]|nr:DUF4876 domain-containing protein [Candidatus Neomarinimicrobiota bacterium]
MRTHKNMKKIIKHHLAPLCFLILFIILSCTQNITPPASMRFSVEITVLDTSASDSDSLVSAALVVMQSISYGEIHEALTNSQGIASFTNLIPDRYNILASGERVSLSEIIIINGQLQDTSLYIEENDTLDLRIITQTSRSSALVISEIYYSGAPPNPVPQYFHDQFLEIYNNSSATLYLDSLIIADVDYGHYEDSVIYAIHAYMFPGDGDDYPINPGELIVIAQDAIDHSPAPIHSINLLDADFEYYLSDKGDVDNVNVTNMLQIHHKYGIDFLYSVFKDALVLMHVKDPYKLGYGEFNELLLPKSAVIDGIDYSDNLAEIDHKRLSPDIDGGLTGGIPSYSNKSLERYIDRIEDGRIILMDNNNSSLDFHVLHPPTPGYIEMEAEE